MNYKQTLEKLYSMLPDYQDAGADAYKPGLERITKFSRRLGRPDKSFCTIHVAGTNGKGSVCHALASVLIAAGYRTGLYTSPHLYDFRERIRVDGAVIPERAVVDFAQKNLPVMEDLELSFFEATVGMAFDWFEKSDVEVAVIETGLGGRLDATNIVTPILSVITNIGKEHSALLGNTIAEIAGEKAGIIKTGVPVVIGEKDPQSAPVFEKKASYTMSELYYAEEAFMLLGSVQKRNKTEYSFERESDGSAVRLESDLRGAFQLRNITTTLAAIEVLNKRTLLNISKRALKEGLANVCLSTGLRGRWQVIGEKPLIVLDTGHNPHGIREVVEQIGREKYDKLYMVFGLSGDKEWQAILPLLPRDAHYFFTQASVSRAMPAGLLAERAAGFGLEGETVPHVADALGRARAQAGQDDMIFVGGSTFVVADAGAGATELAG